MYSIAAKRLEDILIGEAVLDVMSGTRQVITIKALVASLKSFLVNESDTVRIDACRGAISILSGQMRVVQPEKNLSSSENQLSRYKKDDPADDDFRH